MDKGNSEVWRWWRGWNNKTLPSLFASFPVIAAEPEAIPLAEIFPFRNPPVSSINKQHGAAFTTLTPTYSSDWWGIVEERQGIGKHWESQCNSQCLHHVVLTQEMFLAPPFQISARMVMVSFPFGTNLTQGLQSQQDFSISSMTVAGISSSPLPVLLFCTLFPALPALSFSTLKYISYSVIHGNTALGALTALHSHQGKSAPVAQLKVSQVRGNRIGITGRGDFLLLKCHML